MSISQSGLGPRAPKRRKLSHSSASSGSDSAESAERDIDHNGHLEENEHDGGPVTGTRQKLSAVSRASTEKRQGNGGLQSQVLAYGGMGRSSLMTLQIDDLLSSVRPKYENLVHELEESLNELKRIINDLGEFGPLSASDAKDAFKSTGVAVPFPIPGPSKDTKYVFEYRKPESIEFVGTSACMLNMKSDYQVDLAVKMPSGLLQTKDYLNHRLLYKRAFYLARIAAGIKEAASERWTPEYGLQDDVEHLPMLILSREDPSLIQTKRPPFKIRLLVVMSDGVFPSEKLLPTRNGVRAADIGSNLPATPFYNSSVAMLSSSLANQNLLKDAISDCGAFQDVCLLGGLWLRQRGMDSSISKGGFGSFEWAVVCAQLLFSGGLRGQAMLSSKYSTLQLFKAMLQFLAGRDLREPLVLRMAGLTLPRSDQPTIYDGVIRYNILFKMQPWSYELLRQEAKHTLKALNDRDIDDFDNIFVMRSDEPLLRFDEVYEVLLHEKSLESTSLLQQKLLRAFGNRVELVYLTTAAKDKGVLDKGATSKQRDSKKIQIGLLLNADNANRLVDHGPSAEAKSESEEFRNFWGDKAELRRFKDGSISESLVWSEHSPVTLQITQHVLQHHFSVKADSVRSIVRKVDHLIAPRSSSLPAGALFKLVNDAYNSMTNLLFQLEGLPLSIRSIAPADGQLRYSALKLPLISTPAMPAEVLIQFEGSARWPDSLPAIQHTKIAFLVKLGDLLSATDFAVTTRVGLENTSSTSSGHLNTSYLDIIYPPPAPTLHPIAFRLRIQHDRTLTLIERALSPSSKTLIHGSTREALTSALAIDKRSFVAAPLHTTTFANLCTRFPALSPTIRLLKKWTSSHYLLRHIPDELLELLTARTFLHPYPWSVPATAQTGFLRTLVFLSRWDWAAEPLIVDLSATSDMSSATYAEISTRFEAWRKIDPAMNNVVMFAGSNIDTTGVVWTQGGWPSKVIAARLSALAKAAVELVRSKSVGMTEGDWETLFVSPVGDFDFLVHLKRDRKGGRSVEEERFKNLVLQENSDVDGVGFDPVELFLEDLEKVLGRNVLFFHDSDGGRVVAGLWNPRSLGQKPWRVRLGFSSVPVGKAVQADGEERDMVEINQSGILSEIAMLGEGMIEKIEVIKDLVH